MRWKALLLCLPLLLLGGRTANPEWVHWLRVADIASGLTVGGNPYISPCITSAARKEINADATTRASAFCYPDPERNFVLTRFGVVVTNALDQVTEGCEFVLAVQDDGTSVTGTELASSVIQVGSNNEDTGNCNDTLDAVGEFCMLDLTDALATRTVNAGGWVGIHVNNGVNSGGATCSVSQAVQFVTWGYYP